MSAPTRQLNSSLQPSERELGKTLLACLPAELQLEATNRCRHHCPTCARNYYDAAANPPGEMSPEILAAVAPLFPTAERVLVGGYGEPLLADLTFEILRQARDTGCSTTLITGGGEFDTARCRSLARTRLDELLLSLDGATEDSNRRYRGVSLREVIVQLARLRELLPEMRPVFNVTLQVDNLPELPALVRLAARLRVPEVRVLHQKIYTRTQTENSVFGIAAYAEQVFAEARLEAASLGIELDLPPLSGSRPCEQPYRLLAIRHDGLVQGCCSALFESHIPRMVLGRLPADDPLELWNSPAMVSARLWTLGQGPPEFPCAQCAFRLFHKGSHLRLLDETTHD